MLLSWVLQRTLHIQILIVALYFQILNKNRRLLNLRIKLSRQQTCTTRDTRKLAVSGRAGGPKYASFPGDTHGVFLYLLDTAQGSHQVLSQSSSLDGGKITAMLMCFQLACWSRDGLHEGVSTEVPVRYGDSI